MVAIDVSVRKARMADQPAGSQGDVRGGAVAGLVVVRGVVDLVQVHSRVGRLVLVVILVVELVLRERAFGVLFVVLVGVDVEA